MDLRIGKRKAVLRAAGRRHTLTLTKEPLQLVGYPVKVSKRPPTQAAPTDPYSGQPALRILQFETQYLGEYGEALARLGIEIHAYLGSNAFAVTVPARSMETLHALPFVRGTADYEGRYKLQPAQLDRLQSLRAGLRAGERAQYILKATSWRAVDGFRHEFNARFGARAGSGSRHDGPTTYFSQAMSAEECLQALQDPRILWLEEVTPRSYDVEIGREMAALDGVQYPYGAQGPRHFSGKKVKVHLPEAVDEWHPEFAQQPIPLWDDSKANIKHGTASAGVMAARGMRQNYAGVLPDAQIYFTNADAIDGQPAKRMKLTRELVERHGVQIQSMSWGNAYTEQYNGVSAALDEIAFMFRELLIAQSQGNQGGKGESRPQAWAKNVVAGLGFSHRGTASSEDDTGAHTSTRAGKESRVGRSFAAPADAVKTISPHGEYWDGFDGSSASTPMIAGLMGVIQEMFAGAVFDKAMADPRSLTRDGMAKASTLSAMAIVSAMRHDFETRKNVGLSREAQGWGFPQPKTLLENKHKLFVVNESHPLQTLETKTYDIEVAPGEDRLNVAMVYVDPAAVPGAAKTLVNDLNLKLTAPDGTVYWGNHGLMTGNVSKPGGKPDSIDTVEAILLEKPRAGTWRIEVRAKEINRDAIPGTPVDDVNFGLAVLGGKQR